MRALNGRAIIEVAVTIHTSYYLWTGTLNFRAFFSLSKSKPRRRSFVLSLFQIDCRIHFGTPNYAVQHFHRRLSLLFFICKYFFSFISQRINFFFNKRARLVELNVPSKDQQQEEEDLAKYHMKQMSIAIVK